MSRETAPRLLLDANGRPERRVFGYETEGGLLVMQGPFATNDAPPTYADPEVSGVDHAHLGNDSLAGLLIRSAFGISSNIFGPDGTRDYVDVGSHPEHATAELVDYDQAAAHVIYGHIVMAALYREACRRLMERDEYDPDVRLFVNTRNAYETWATHCNVTASRGVPMNEYIPALLAHNASMIVWSGAGTVYRRRSKSGAFRYALSERAAHIRRPTGNTTLDNRPLVNLRDEPLADPSRYRRIHGISNDGVLIPDIIGLVPASTILILKAVELGVRFDDLVPKKPVEAMHTISNDPRLKRKVKVASGSHYTGVELQMALIERALEATIAADYAVEQDVVWGNKLLELCELLRGDLDSPECLTATNWLVKRALIKRELNSKHAAGDRSSDYAIAFLKSTQFHQTLPTEGPGMTLARKRLKREGVAFDPPLPPETRARLRGEIIRILQENNIDYAASWDAVAAFLENGKKRHLFEMPNPLQYEDEAAMRKLAALVLESSGL